MSIESLKKFCSRHNVLYIYGAGGYGRMLAAYLGEQGTSVSGFVETKRSSDSVMGLPVKEPHEISGACGFIVGTGQRYADEIVHLLREYGFSDFFRVTPDLMEDVQNHTRYDREITVRKKFVNVILYHRIADKREDVWNLAVTPVHFDEQIRYIKENYNIIRFEDEWDEITEKSVSVTFDDGYVDNYKFALPILEKYGVPATFFISTGNIGTGREFWWDRLALIFMSAALPADSLPIGKEKLSLQGNVFQDMQTAHKKLKSMPLDEREETLDRWEHLLCPRAVMDREGRSMNQEELKRMADSALVTIGGHTVSHPALSGLTSELQRWEIEESKASVEKIIGRNVDVFSYPFGGRPDFDEETVRILRGCGYKKAAANWRGTAGEGVDGFRIPRNKVWDGDADEFGRQLRGTWMMFGDE